MLDYLRGENSKLTDEVAFLRGQLKLKSGGNTASGDSSLGAVQLGQLAFSCARGCLKRLSGPSHRNEEGSRQISIESDSGSETSVLELYVTEYQGTVGLSAWFSRCSGWAIFGSWLSGCSGWAIFGSGFSRCRCRASSAASSRDAAVGSTAAGRSSAAERGSSAAEHSPCTEASEGGIIAENIPANPWNRFQKDHKGLGLSKQTMSKIYQYEKRKDKMP